MLRAARAQDREAVARLVSTRDPSFPDRVRVLSANLAALPLAQLEVALQPPVQALTPSRRELLGADAWVQPALLTWRLTGERAAARHTVWLTFVRSDGIPLLAGTGDRAGGARTPEPIWWTGPVTADRDGGVAVVVGAGQSPGPWLDRARQAAAEVRDRVTAAAAARWDGALVVEVPASRRDTETVLGAAPGSYAGIAAVTLAEGPASAAVRVVVNPEVARALAPVGVAVVLTHEAVHVATRSADSPAPLWVVEGFADEIALRAHPEAEAAAAEPLLREVRRAGPPDSLPADERFRTGAEGLDVTYAAAWSACRYITQQHSPAALQRLYTALDGGTRPDAAVRDVLGLSVAALTAGWRRELVRLAGG